MLALYRAAKSSEEKRALMRMLSMMDGDAALEAIDAALEERNERPTMDPGRRRGAGLPSTRCLRSGRTETAARWLGEPGSARRGGRAGLVLLQQLAGEGTTHGHRASSTAIPTATETVNNATTDAVKVYARMTGGKLDRLQALSATCPVESTTPVQPLGDVSTDDSTRWLVAQVKQDGKDAVTVNPSAKVRWPRWPCTAATCPAARWRVSRAMTRASKRASGPCSGCRSCAASKAPTSRAP